MGQYWLSWQDNDGRWRVGKYHASSDANAITIADRLQADSACARRKLVKLTEVQTWSAAPTDPSTVDATAMMVYDLEDPPGGTVRVTLPDPTQLSGGDTPTEPLTTTIVGLVQSEEGNDTDSHRRSYWKWRGQTADAPF